MIIYRQGMLFKIMPHSTRSSFGNALSRKCMLRSCAAPQMQGILILTIKCLGCARACTYYYWAKIWTRQVGHAHAISRELLDPKLWGLLLIKPMQSSNATRWSRLISYILIACRHLEKFCGSIWLGLQSSFFTARLIHSNDCWVRHSVDAMLMQTLINELAYDRCQPFFRCSPTVLGRSIYNNNNNTKIYLYSAKIQFQRIVQKRQCSGIKIKKRGRE